MVRASWPPYECQPVPCCIQQRLAPPQRQRADRHGGQYLRVAPQVLGPIQPATAEGHRFGMFHVVVPAPFRAGSAAKLRRCPEPRGPSTGDGPDAFRSPTSGYDDIAATPPAQGSALAPSPRPSYLIFERLARAGASPTWSGPEGSSHNDYHLGRRPASHPTELCRRRRLRRTFPAPDRYGRPPRDTSVSPPMIAWPPSRNPLAS